MENAKINGSQLFVLIVLFEMGSAILFNLGGEAKQDAWIAILIGLLGGILLFLIYYRLYKFFPDLPLTSYTQKIMGKWIGKIIGFLYIIYFLYISARVLRDFGALLVSAIYTTTPLFVINTLMMLTIIYAIHKGIEVIARVGQLYIMIIYFLAILGFILIIFSGEIRWGNLLPIYENGWRPIFNAVIGQTLTFPFGEMIVCTMLLPFVNDQKKAKWACLGGMILAGINITITAIINISVLGVIPLSRSSFPLLNTIGRIEIAEFIERLDVFFMIYLVIAGFFKVTIFYYAAVAGSADLFQLKNQRMITYPIGFLILIASLTIAESYSEHVEEGLKYVPYFVHWPMQIILPIILLIIAFIRYNKKGSSPSSEQGNQNFQGNQGN
ncbi:GerAB/ArcD/ProY family transporter [Neobacillus thermocopriae]|uniref:GerAB/ArcD/ProY family transporter n=1 Tax=Neobacillus thermocopriae TaxID=1215031 RepID=UPI003770461B